MSAGALRLRRGDDLDAAHLGHGEGAVHCGGHLGLCAAGESEGEEAALEFGFGLRGQAGYGGADVGQNNCLAEERDRLGLSGAGSGYNDRPGLGGSRRRCGLRCGGRGG